MSFAYVQQQAQLNKATLGKPYTVHQRKGIGADGNTFLQSIAQSPLCFYLFVCASFFAIILATFIVIYANKFA